MLQSRKNNPVLILLGALLGLACTNTHAGIVLEYGANYSTVAPPPAFLNRSMKGIVLQPAYGVQTETGYLLQRSHAWQANPNRNSRAGAALIYPPMVGMAGAPSSARQMDVRTNLSRAHAYRQGYYKR